MGIINYTKTTTTKNKMRNFFIALASIVLVQAVDIAKVLELETVQGADWLDSEMSLAQRGRATSAGGRGTSSTTSTSTTSTSRPRTTSAPTPTTTSSSSKPSSTSTRPSKADPGRPSTSSVGQPSTRPSRSE